MRTEDALAYDLSTIIKKWSADKAKMTGAEQVQAIVHSVLRTLAVEFGGDGMDWLSIAIEEYQDVDTRTYEV
jgi:hypothetical protein